MRVFQTFNRNEARRVIHITQHKGQADLCVYIVKSKSLAYKEAYWYISKNKLDSDAAFYFGSRGSACVNVYFVNSQAQAGWQNDHPLKGRLKY
ncbi:hypothetical protein KIH87_10085 [Paraneptunicella aestuarii]|uniref:DUF6150 family protein n=1 Tax=Paraneptunicella aestuarii TaxID=2831148 RepID=UPI001E564CD1|nr:DUF6150 family protein [Paraneptunicella aestuarii]UAA37101.1 hypothetical protein KIH87_10085 [Paraneptunicella aestuarii]